MPQREIAYLLLVGSVMLLGSGCGPSVNPPPQEELEQRESAHEQLSEEMRAKYKGGPKRAHGK